MSLIPSLCLVVHGGTLALKTVDFQGLDLVLMLLVVAHEGSKNSKNLI